MANYNKRISEFNPNVAQVWVEEPDFSGYKALDFTKIDNIEDLLKSGINVNVTGANQLTINGNVTVSNEVEVKNEQNNPIPIQGSVFNSDITSLKDTLNNVIFSEASSPSGVIVYQTNLNKDLDNVSVYVSGDLPNISLAPNQGLNILNFPAVQNVSSTPSKSNTISNFNPGTYNGSVLNPNNLRKELYIQNLSTGNLYVKYGQDASNESFNFILAGNTAENAGDGGSLSDQSYGGEVSVSGENPRYISWERT